MQELLVSSMRNDASVCEDLLAVVIIDLYYNLQAIVFFYNNSNGWTMLEIILQLIKVNKIVRHCL